MRERLLTQHFLQRFLENDLLSPDADRHGAIAMVCGGLLTLGLFLSIGISMKFLFMLFRGPAGRPYSAVGNGLAFVAMSMVVMSLVAVVTWDALSLDPRDTAIFGPLPIERGVIVRAKLRAVGILAGGFAVAIGGLSSLFHPALMVASLPIGIIPAFALIVIPSDRHAGGGPLRLCVGGHASGDLARAARDAFLPDFCRLTGGHHRGAGHEFPTAPCDSESGRTARAAAAQMLPPIWFVGLHEALAGRLVAGLPRGALPEGDRPGRKSRRGRLPGDRGRVSGRWPGARSTALTTTLALAVAASLELSTAALAPGRQSRGRVPGPGLFARTMTLTVVRRPATQAGFFFTLQCLYRSGPHGGGRPQGGVDRASP